MKRRKMLKTIAAGGIASLGVQPAAGRIPVTRQRSTDELDVLHVVRDGNVVRSVENPTSVGLKRLQESLSDEEFITASLVEPTCIVYCKEDCYQACPTRRCDYENDCLHDSSCCQN